MTSLALDQVLRKINNLPSLPAVVMELLASIEQEDVNLDTLAHGIAQDQALAAKTLRVANSSFYGMAHQITTINEAIAVLGFRAVRSLATTAALVSTFDSHKPGQIDFAPFWRHSVATAVCARELAKHLQLNTEHAYTTGLLHDIGRLVLATQFQIAYQDVMAYRTLHDCTLLQAERAVLNIDHAVVGHAMTGHWKFPQEMQQAIANHHSPELAPSQTLPRVIQVADALAHALDLSRDEDDLVPEVSPATWQLLELDDATLLAVMADAERQFEGASLVLAI